MSIITTKGGIVDTVVAGQGITVDNTDPANPIVISDIVAGDYYTKNETDYLLDTKQNLLPIPTTGVGSSSTNPMYALQDGTILYHSSRWFTPSGTVSTSGVTVTSIGTQFTSAMVGAKITINGESRIITAFTSSTVVTVGVAFSQNYSGVIAGSWGVYNNAYKTLSNGNIQISSSNGKSIVLSNMFGDTASMSLIANMSLVLSGGNAGVVSENFGFFGGETVLANTYRFGWSSTSNKYGTKDIGLRRNAAGVLEIFDGVTATGLLANRRDLLVRNINGISLGLGGGNIIDNAAFGAYALQNNTTGTFNAAFGNLALQNNSTGVSNMAFGRGALQNNTTGIANVGIGDYAVQGLSSGSNNTGLGKNVLQRMKTGSSNIGMGFGAGQLTSTGTNNATCNDSIFIGSTTVPLGDNQTNQIVIGNAAVGLGSNTVVLGNSSITTTALRGNVGIGTTTPTEKLDVNGNIKATQYRVSALNTAPASATDTGTTGEIRYTADYIYVCTATNTWKRTAITTW